MTDMVTSDFNPWECSMREMVTSGFDPSECNMRFPDDFTLVGIFRSKAFL
ncbi:MAG TPA: hypothetical protein VFM70_03450 [Salinimicrobium sp.]|nr:hypothetical protein [Salinimicrobium sp.]